MVIEKEGVSRCVHSLDMWRLCAVLHLTSEPNKECLFSSISPAVAERYSIDSNFSLIHSIFYSASILVSSHMHSRTRSEPDEGESARSCVASARPGNLSSSQADAPAIAVNTAEMFHFDFLMPV